MSRNQRIGNVTTFLEASEEANQNSAFLVTNPTGVKILWEP